MEHLLAGLRGQSIDVVESSERHERLDSGLRLDRLVKGKEAYLGRESDLLVLE
jgi:hypothetical protein